MKNEIFDNMLSRYDLTTEQHKRNAIFEVNQQMILAGLYAGGFFESAAFYGVSWQNYIRFSWKTFDIDTIAKSAGKKSLAEHNFRFRTLIFDSGHDFRSFFSAPNIHINRQFENPAFLNFCKLK